MKELNIFQVGSPLLFSYFSSFEFSLLSRFLIYRIYYKYNFSLFSVKILALYIYIYIYIYVFFVYIYTKVWHTWTPWNVSMRPGILRPLGSKCPSSRLNSLDSRASSLTHDMNRLLPSALFMFLKQQLNTFKPIHKLSMYKKKDW